MVIKWYVSAPIWGLSPSSVKESFERGRTLLQKSGYAAVLPIEVEPYQHEGECPEGRKAEGMEHTDVCHMRGDLLALLDCDGILMMAGWESSWGCRTELQVAAICGITVKFEEDMVW